MATTVPVSHIPVGEYLGSVYRPDVDYVDGVLEERNVGEFDHASIQKAVLFALAAQERTARVRAMQELRVQVTETRFRIPDVCLLRAGLRTPIIREPPLLCVEILSPRDTVTRMRHRCQDYLRLGIPEVWIFDPQARVAYVLTKEGMAEYHTGILRLNDSMIELGVETVFATLDEE